MRTDNGRGLELSYTEDTTDLGMRGIMNIPESAPCGTKIDMTLANGKLIPAPEVRP
jgi:hypothetical protein